MTSVKLTQFSHGAGCGCKLSPAVLSEILERNGSGTAFTALLVGNEHKDDAAVWQLDAERTILSTTDFFMPVVDDPFDFGRIAATNAISDIYAMGGTPVMAIAILGWPVDKLPASVAGQVVAGGKAVCMAADIPLAGGHSIDCPEPIFGLAVTGIGKVDSLKTNAGARPGDILFLTKPLGVGILTTAQKRGLLLEEHLEEAIKWMTTLNTVGAQLATLPGIHALTDVTGFGLLGHLLEICQASGVSAVVESNKVPVFPFLQDYILQKAIPGGTKRNWDSYQSQISVEQSDMVDLLCDPQTSGGLLIAVDPVQAKEVAQLLENQQLCSGILGTIVPKGPTAITVC
jgi:selenide,water dikinase